MGLCPDCLFAAALGSESTSEADDVLPATSGIHWSAPSYESFGLCSSVVEPPSTEGPEPFGLDEPSGPDLDGTRLVHGSHQTHVWLPSFVRQAGPELPRDPKVPGYEILGMLGRGGMGVVYKGLQCRARRLVALKMVRSDATLQPEQFERFRVEAQAVARLHHPNVVQIYEVGEVDGRPYFSLELLEGGTLRDKLAAAMMAPRPAAELLVVLTRAIEAAHGAGVIHRDLKPSNVLFDAQGTPKIVDFGLAKWLESEEGQTLTGQVMGTPSYMSPEQARGDNRAVGRTADIYALGAILYEMLTGRPPFKGTSLRETIDMVVSQDPIAPSRFRQKVPRDLETICLKCLEKDPARRYQTASELADDLERYLSGVPVRARRTPVWERAAKWARRRPATTTLAAVGLLVALTLASAAERNHRRLGTRRREALFELERGREQRRRGALEDARLTFSTVATKLGPESKTADLVRVAEDELRVVDRLRILEAARAVDQERLARFRRLRDEALFLDAQFAGSVDEGRLKRTRAAARGALAVFAANGDDPLMPGPPPVSLAPEQREEVASGCYWMLMVLSDAVARRLPGEDDRRPVQESLRYLDGAAKLRGPTLAYHLRRVDCLERLGDREAARAERARADALKPTEAFDHILVGQEWSRSGDWNAARKHFEEAVREQPNLFWAHCLLAIADLNSRPPRVEAARAELTNCLTRQPSYPWLYLLRGTAYSQMGLSLAALARSSRDPALAGESQAQFENAEADFRAAEGLGGDVDIGYALRMNRGVLRFERQRYREAAADFEAAIALDPRRYNAYASRAHALRKLGRRDEAIEDLSRAIALEPEMAALYRGRAMARLDRDDLPPSEVSLAIQDLEESARRESPPSSRVAADDHVRRGRLFLRLDHTGAVLDAALAAAEAALGIAPDLAGAHLLRIDALLKMGRDREVIAACDDALAKVPPSARLHFYRGLGRTGRRDFAGAIDDYTRALALRPDNEAEIHLERGWAYLYAQAFALALEDFEAAIHLEPARPSGYAGRGAARVRLGRIPEALDDVERSLGRAEPSNRILYIAAQTYAKASARAAAEVAPQRPASRASLAYEARAAGLLEQALKRTAADQRAAFWRDIVARDGILAPLLRNAKIRRPLESIILSSS